MKELSPESAVVYTGAEFNATASVTPPIFQTSTFAHEDGPAFAARAMEPMSTAFYTRYGNPTLQHAAAVIAELEKAETGLVFASGVGAASTTALGLLKAGDHVVAQRVLYTGNQGLLREVLAKFGVSTTFVDQDDIGAFEAAITPNTRLIWVETPSNPLLKLTDLSAIAKLARKHGILTLCDNTVATPINQRPIELGIDMVLHSATKAMGGHSDIIAGAIAGRRELLEQIWAASIVIGATLGPIDGWLLLRGLRTLPLRCKQLDKNALSVAEYLAKHPRVSNVFYPGLKSHKQYDLAVRQMKGFGCLLSFEIDGDAEMAERFIGNLRHVTRAVSLGSYDSLIARPGAVWSVHADPAKLLAAGISQSLLRLSVGIENEDDLIADLDQAFAAL